MLNSNSEIKKFVASALMCLISLIRALSICCCHSASATKGGASTKNGKTSSTADTNLEDLTLQDVFMMLREKFPEDYAEVTTFSENTSPQNDRTPQNETPPSIWEDCCNIC